jgi:tRNA threonylcarbamoyladenosine biosynthesis protein TsaB
LSIILHIETATPSCSVAISEHDQLLSVRETHTDRSHAEQLTVFIEELFKETRLNAKKLDGIAISKGPGSYTGLRIGVSAAKGLAYGSGIPMIAINTLEIMASGFLMDYPSDLKGSFKPFFICPLIDARRMEVYSAVFGPNLKQHEETRAEIIHPKSFESYLERGSVYIFGTGADKCKEVIKHKNAIFIEEFKNSARHMVIPAWKLYEKQTFVDVAYFEPHYLKDFVATTPKNKVLGSN